MPRDHSLPFMLAIIHTMVARAIAIGAVDVLAQARLASPSPKPICPRHTTADLIRMERNRRERSVIKEANRDTRFSKRRYRKKKLVM